MLREAWIIGRLAALELRRQRLLPAMATAMLLILLGAIPFASVTMGSMVETVVDIGLAAMALILNLLAIILTAQVLHQDRERRTLHILLPRLAHRHSYLPGKFIGIALPLSVLLLIMGALILLCAALLGWSAWGALTAAILATLLEVWMVIAITLLFCNSSSQFLAIFGAITIDIAGHFGDVVRQLGEQAGGAAGWLATTVWYLLPNLSVLSLRDQVLSLHAIAATNPATIVLYGLTETALLITLATLLHGRRPVEGG